MLPHLASLALLAAPTPAELPPLTGALPSLRDAVSIEGQNKGGAGAGEKLLPWKPAGCEAARVVRADKVVHLSLYAVEKLQGWFNLNPGLEEKLFAAKGTLGEVSKLAAGGAVAPERKCALPVADGWKLKLDAAPPEKCKAAASAAPQAWWSHGGKISALVALGPAQKGAADACRPRASAVLFDQAGRARVRVHTDLEGAPEITLLGDKCQHVELAFDENLNGFKARATSCKP